MRIKDRVQEKAQEKRNENYMNEERETLADAVRQTHGGKPSYVGTETVSETFRGVTVWSRSVSTFDLAPDAPARRAFAWVESVPGTTRVRFFAVLPTGPIESAWDAVRASLLQDGNRPK